MAFEPIVFDLGFTLSILSNTCVLDAQELAKIRYDLCPRHMKDKQFWRIYFLLAKSYTSPYELRAIQKEKVRRMETENGKAKDVTTVEVEMQESK
uniref:BSD domain-containing protein n=1 Tax=Oryza meridionalis TaxID=40149 RepID=A0A0E0DJJ5_9ORYZ